MVPPSVSRVLQREAPGADGRVKQEQECPPVAGLVSQCYLVPTILNFSGGLCACAVHVSCRLSQPQDSNVPFSPVR